MSPINELKRIFTRSRVSLSLIQLSNAWCNDKSGLTRSSQIPCRLWNWMGA